jgi:hypothetical protein
VYNFFYVGLTAIQIIYLDIKGTSLGIRKLEDTINGKYKDLYQIIEKD